MSREFVMKLFGGIGIVFVVGMCVSTGRGDTHIYAGALGTNQNDRLQFSNAAAFEATLSSFAFPQVLRTNGLNAGFYRGDVVTFSALAATEENGGPIPGSAALGARLAVEVVSVEGPASGSFQFWEGDGESSLGAITFSVPVGTTNGTNRFLISENNGERDADPYGHVHGRAITTSLAGTYVVGFRAVDLSTNGVGGGPIHAASEVLRIRFQAGLRIEEIAVVTNGVAVRFRSPPGISNLLETSDLVLPGNWQAAAQPLRGNNNLQTIVDTNTAAASRFYRLRQLNNLP